MQQVTQSHSCRLEAHDERERNRTPWLTLRLQGVEIKKRGEEKGEGGRGKKVLGSVTESEKKRIKEIKMKKKIQ